ncbi:MAG: hypothetical protein DWQ47_02085 [Acidobacteria bacterium]|nr:MAG: hypothetical protein DWQ32_05635 [Acidobacteriota bacterium]REK01211.1 MAG: hypothetical protein DWQ38_02070 [Acidobacteriota bacterium]REK14167.1 MAG: hypothetical protein DWQ43_11325 [Acidobacteriota bacterium]REK44882.1 MAG: hypothetical protein DWQ47_02085 [Acidobacteriota bacterium]
MSTKRSPKKKRPETCPRCGSDFKCGFYGVFCWCAGVKLSKGARSEIADRFSGCLCMDCLTEYSEKAPTGTRPT